MSKVIKKIMIILFVTSVFYNWTQDISEYNKIVYVRTSDNEVKQLERWKINEMQSLLVLFEHQKGNNSEATPLQAANLKSNELDLLSPALTAISNGKFEDFYNNIIEEDRKLLSTKEKEEIKQHELGQKVLSLDQGKLRTLINASEKVNAQGVSAFCLSSIMPIEAQKKLLVPQLINRVKQKIAPISQMLVGHPEYVNTVAFSPDGTKVVSGSDGTQDNLILWDISNINTITHRNLLDQIGNIRTIAFSPPGTKIASGCEYFGGKYLILWDISNLNAIASQVLIGHQSYVTAIAFNTDGTKMVTGSEGTHNNLILWDISNPDAIKSEILAGHPGGVHAVAFSLDGTKIVSGGFGDANNLLLWDISNPNKIPPPLELVGHSIRVVSVAFSPDGTKIISGASGNQDNVILWDISNIKAVTSYILADDPAAATVVRFSPDGTKIVAGKYACDQNLIIWAINDLTPHVLVGHHTGTNTIAFNSSGTKMVTGGEGRFGSILLWDISNLNAITHQKLKSYFRNDIISVAFSPDGTKIVAGINSRENNLILFSLLSKTEETALDNCNIAQAQLLYQIAIASTYRIPIDFQQPSIRGSFNALPDILQKICIERFKVEPKPNNKTEAKQSWIEWLKSLPSHYKAMLGLGTAGISYVLYKYLSQQKE